MSVPLSTVTYTDFDIAFGSHPVTNDLNKKTGINSVVQSVMDLVQTNHFERAFHPEIGGNIRKLLFELVDPITANLISEEIKDVLANYEPRVSNVQVYVTADDEQDGYKVVIVFNIVGIPTSITVSTFLTRLR